MLPAAWAPAAPGDLDATFSGDGVQTLDFGFGGQDAANAVARQADGKLVVAGQNDEGMVITRLNADGTADPSFAGSDGVVEADAWRGAADVEVQADGKIVAVRQGSAPQGTAAMVVRYNSDGSRDNSFSGDGEVTVPQVRNGATLALQPDGRIVIAGSADIGDHTGFALARLNTDGTPDEGFSGDGTLAHDFAGSGAYANDVAIQPDGKIVVGGSVETGTEESSGSDYALVRYDEDGELDASFSGDGLQTTNFVIGYQGISDIALQDDGKIVATGDTIPWEGTWGIGVVRYNESGELDPSFDDDGLQVVDLGTEAGAQSRDVAIQQDGRIVVAGKTDTWSFLDPSDFAIVRLTAGGELDVSFSGDGMQTTDFGGRDAANALLVDPAGRIVTAGEAHPSDLGVARYASDGALDGEFSGDGKTTADFPGYEDANDVLVQPDGKIVVIGSNGGDYGPGSVALVRYEPDGSLDPSFAGDGVQTTSFDAYGFGIAGALQADGKIVAVGGRELGNEDPWLVARYTNAGELDLSFSNDGKQTFPNFGSFATASDVVILPDGKIVIVGIAEDHDDEPTGLGIVRLNPDGTLDTSFAGDGMRTLGNGESFEQPRIAVLEDAKIAVATIGITDNPWMEGLQVSRLNADGSLDTTFDGDGQQTIDLTDHESVIGIVAQPDGKIVAATGGFRLNGPYPTELVRFTKQGSLDASFAGDGRQTLEFDYSYNNGGDLLLRPDGKLVLVVRPGIVQVTATGQLDTTFSDDGFAWHQTWTLDRMGRAALDADGAVLVAGSIDGDLALERYEGQPLPVDTTPPQTTITSGVSGTTSIVSPTFAFTSNEAASTFECRLDTAVFTPCSSPHATGPLTLGAHTFEVRAIDQAGNVDLSPASRSFSIAATPPNSDLGASPSPQPTSTAPSPTPPAPAVSELLTSKQSQACKKAKAKRQMVQRKLTGTRKRLRSTTSPAAKRHLRKALKKQRAAHRKAAAQILAAC